MAIKPLHRRTVLRGMAGGISAAIALPLLEAMLDGNGEALADGSALPVRFMTWFWGNGIVPNSTSPGSWEPASQGAGYALTEQLLPFASVKDYLTVLTGFDSQVSNGTKITHHEGMSIFNGFDNADVGEGQGFYSNAGGITIDQRIADVPGFGDCTPIKSVQLGVSKKESTADYGTTMHNLSHRGYNQPLPPQHNPLTAFQILFDMFVPEDDPQGPLRVSVLDLVRAQVAKLKLRLGAVDKARMDAHLDGISQLQTKIEALPPSCAPLDMSVYPANVQNNVESNGTEPIKGVAEAMADIVVKAFECDVTRVASYLFVEGAGEHLFRDLGGDNNSTEHHLLTHNSSKVTAIKAGVIYSMEQLAYLANQLANTPDSTIGSMLDNTVIFASSDCSAGWTHSVNNQPMLILGGGGGKLVHPGIHYASPNGENPTDVLLALLQLFDPAATSVGAGPPMSTTPFDGIKA